MKIIAPSCPRKTVVYALIIALCSAVLTVFGGSKVYAGPIAKLVYVVNNDRGGIVGNRAEEITQLLQEHKRVEIRGRVCLSSCTMYLGAGNVCVSPRTKFGFHGPSDHGRPLKPHQFEYWSQVIASFYPSRLRDWYMEKGRYKSEGYYTMTGAQLIALGIPQC